MPPPIEVRFGGRQYKISFIRSLFLTIDCFQPPPNSHPGPLFSRVSLLGRIMRYPGQAGLSRRIFFIALFFFVFVLACPEPFFDRLGSVEACEFLFLLLYEYILFVGCR